MDQTLVKYGQEHGKNLHKICKKLIHNQNLLKLLMNTDVDPLNPEKHPDEIDGLSVIQSGQIRFIPLVTAEDQTTTSKIVVIFDEGDINASNPDNENISLLINVYCPFKEWSITGDDLRPYAIMAEIRKSIQDRRINGLGEIQYLGFSLSTLTEEMGSFIMRFSINAFS